MPALDLSNLAKFNENNNQNRNSRRSHTKNFSNEIFEQNKLQSASDNRKFEKNDADSKSSKDVSPFVQLVDNHQINNNYNVSTKSIDKYPDKNKKSSSSKIEKRKI